MTEPMKIDEWNASPKKQKPLADKLNDLSKKIHKAERAVRNENGEIIGMVPFEIYNTIRIQEVASERERIKNKVKEIIAPPSIDFISDIEKLTKIIELINSL